MVRFFQWQEEVDSILVVNHFMITFYVVLWKKQEVVQLSEICALSSYVNVRESV